MSGVERRARWDDLRVSLWDAIAEANRVTARMPTLTRKQRRAQAEKFVAVLHEWHEAQQRWKPSRH